MPTDLSIPAWAKADFNSLICNDMSNPEWENPFGVSVLIHGAPSYGLANGGYDGVLLNAAGNSGGTGLFRTRFGVPAGVTSATIQVLVASSSGTTTILVEHTDASYSSVLASQRFTITTTAQFCQLTTATLAPGTYYGLRISINDIGQQARPYVWQTQVTPRLTSSGVFSGDFYRLRAYRLFGGTSLAPTLQASGLYWSHGRQAEVEIQTDASSIAVECYSTIDVPFGGPGKVGVIVDGKPWAMSSSFVYPSVSMQEITLPVTPGDPDIRNVVVRADPRGFSGFFCYMTHIYVPASANTRIPLRQPTERMVVIGDSITNAFNCTDPLFSGWVARVRSVFPGPVCVHAEDGQTLFTLAPDATTAAALAAQIGQLQPTIIIIDLGTNDYGLSTGGALWATAAAFGTAYGALVDALLAACPAARIICKTPLKRTSPAVETANGNGWTLAQGRTQIQTVATTGRPRCIFVDGTAAAWSQVQGTDGIHPDTNGYAQNGTAMVAAVQSAGFL